MMMKKIPCPECNGLGYTLIAIRCDLVKITCDNCGGTGTIEVPMTNADRVRSMTDEELASFMVEDDFCEVCEHLRDDGLCEIMASETDQPLGNYCRAAALRWLQQPAEENRKDDTK